MSTATSSTWMHLLDDPKLVTLARDGNQEAFAELYRRYFDRVYDFVARMMRNQAEAEDVAQDTFIKAMNNIVGLRENGNFKSWIFTIARNTALNRIERSRRTRPLEFQTGDDESVDLDAADPDRFGSPDEAVQAASTAALVWEAAAGLNPKQYSLLDLHLRQGLESAEIADVLGVTPNNGYVMLNRLKTAVEESIGAYVMMREGRAVCSELDRELSNASVTGISPKSRRLVMRHVRSCDICRETQSELVSPSSILAAFAPIPAAPGVKENILADVLADWPDGGHDGQGSDAGQTPASISQFATGFVAWIDRHLLLLSAIASIFGLSIILAALLAPANSAVVPEGSIAISFETANGEPVPGVQVSIHYYPDGAELEYIVTATTDDSGVLEIPNVEAGSYQLVIERFPPQYALLDTGQSSEFFVESGQNVTIRGVFRIVTG